MKKYRFKSSTDINNYNKFLLDLDGVIKENKKVDIVKQNEPLQTCVDIINKIYDFIYFLFIILINASMERSDILHLILLQFLYYFIPIIALLHYCIIALLQIYFILFYPNSCIIANIFYIILL